MLDTLKEIQLKEEQESRAVVQARDILKHQAKGAAEEELLENEWAGFPDSYALDYTLKTNLPGPGIRLKTSSRGDQEQSYANMVDRQMLASTVNYYRWLQT